VAERFRNKYRSGSARLYAYDYSRKGAYFVTICTRTKISCLGKIVDSKMILSDIGIIVNRYWIEIQEHFQNICLDEFVIMPDYIHGIIIIKQKIELNSDPLQIETSNLEGMPLGETPRLNEIPRLGEMPRLDETPRLNEIPRLGEMPRLDETPRLNETPKLGVSTGAKLGNPYWKSNSIGSIINQFKRICTIKTRSAGLDLIWQPRYYDRVIRCHAELEFIRNYIRNNVVNWNIDDQHIDSVNL
jgi:putative transposase